MAKLLKNSNFCYIYHCKTNLKFYTSRKNSDFCYIYHCNKKYCHTIFKKNLIFLLHLPLQDKCYISRKNSDFCYIYHCKIDSICAEKVWFFVTFTIAKKNLLYITVKKILTLLHLSLHESKCMYYKLWKSNTFIIAKKNHMYRRVSKILIFVTFTIAKLECWLGEFF